MNQVIMLQDEPRGPSVLIEVQVNVVGVQRVMFPDIAQLRSTVDRSVVLKSLRLITPDVLTNPMLATSANAPLTELQKMALVIYAEGWEKAQFIPLLTLNDMSTPTLASPHRYGPTYFDNWQRVDWTKTYLQFGNGTASVGAPYTVIFDCQYQVFDAAGRALTGPS